MAEAERSGIDYIRDVAMRSKRLLDDLQGENEQQQRLIRELRDRLEAALDQLDADEEVRRERDELKLAVAAQREELRSLHEELLAVRGLLEKQRSERAELRRLVEEMDARRNDIVEQQAAVELQYSNLLSLYVASCQLQQTTDLEEVFTIVQEVVINLIGCEELAIYEIDPAEMALRVVRSYGLESHQTEVVKVGIGTVGKVAATGVPFISVDSDGDPELEWERGLTACVPLSFRGEVLGVVATFGMLAQKTETITDVDRELFDLLSSHAGAALYYTGLSAGGAVTAPLSAK